MGPNGWSVSVMRRWAERREPRTLEGRREREREREREKRKVRESKRYTQKHAKMTYTYHASCIQFIRTCTYMQIHTFTCITKRIETRIHAYTCKWCVYMYLIFT